MSLSDTVNQRCSHTSCRCEVGASRTDVAVTLVVRIGGPAVEVAGLVARPLPLGELAHVVAQLDCDLGLHRHVPLRAQSDDSASSYAAAHARSVTAFPFSVAYQGRLLQLVSNPANVHYMGSQIAFCEASAPPQGQPCGWICTSDPASPLPLHWPNPPRSLLQW